MASNNFKIKNGVNVQPTTQAASEAGDLRTDSAAANALKFHDGTSERIFPLLSTLPASGAIPFSDSTKLLGHSGDLSFNDGNNTLSVGASTTSANGDIIIGGSGTGFGTITSGALLALRADELQLVTTSTDEIGFYPNGTKSVAFPNDGSIEEIQLLSTPSTPASGYQKFYPKNDGNFYGLRPDGTEFRIGAGGAGGVNYAEANPDAETNASSWTTYADAAATPVDLTGGSPTATWTRSTSNPLRGAGSFLFTAGALGNGTAITITPARADVKRGGVLTGSIEYEPSATTATGDYTIWVYDVANSLLIQPTGYQIPGVATGTAAKHVFTFQLPTNATTLRVAIHQAVSSPGGNLKVDSVAISPQALAYGAPITDWKTYTPTFSAGLGTVTFPLTTVPEWRRVGDSIEIRGFAAAGTVAASVLTIGIPAGLTLAYSDTTIASGSLVTSYSGSAALAGMFPIIVPATSTTAFCFTSNGSRNAFTILNGSDVLTNTASFSWTAKGKIAGWSSSVQMSDSADTRVVAANITGDPASASSGNPIIVPTITFDTHGAYSVSTGNFTAPVPGYYQFHGSLASANTAVALFIEGSFPKASLGVGTTDSNGEATFTGLIYMNAGNTAHLTGSGTLDASACNLSIQRLSGPASIAASETVAMRANTSTTSGNSTPATAIFSVVDYDTHGGYATGTGRYTVPISGRYSVKTAVNFASTAFSAGASESVHLYKNGNQISQMGNKVVEAARTEPLCVWGSDDIRCLAGDILDVRLGGSVVALDGVATNNYLSITRIGNY